MKAAVIKSPGVIEVEEVPTPKPGEGEVLLKVEACALCGTDQRVLKGEKNVDVAIVGHEITGAVAEVELRSSVHRLVHADSVRAYRAEQLSIALLSQRHVPDFGHEHRCVVEIELQERPDLGLRECLGLRVDEHRS